MSETIEWLLNLFRRRVNESSLLAESKMSLDILSIRVCMQMAKASSVRTLNQRLLWSRNRTTRRLSTKTWRLVIWWWLLWLRRLWWLWSVWDSLKTGWWRLLGWWWWLRRGGRLVADYLLIRLGRLRLGWLWRRNCIYKLGVINIYGKMSFVQIETLRGL